MRLLVVIILIAGAPLTYPAWTIERVIRRHRPDFEFGIYTSVPYFSGVAVISIVAVLAVHEFLVQVIAMYALTMMELISLATCAVIAVIRAGRLQNLMRTVTRRTFTPQAITARPATIFASVVSIIYAIVYFGILSYAIWQANASYFGGVSASWSTPYRFWQFAHNSFLTIINNNGPLTEARFATQLIYDTERVIGIFLLVFVLGVLVSGWTEHAVRSPAPLGQAAASSEAED
jgi:hypothetical protein